MNLQLAGTNFDSTATVLWNGSPRTTTFLNSGSLTAAISAQDLAAAGTVAVSMETGTQHTLSNAVTFTIKPSASLPLAITTKTLPNGTSGTTYAATLAASGGTPPYQWSIVAGTLPSGISVDVTSGVISGTPISQGNFTFTVQARDSSSTQASAQAPLALNVTAAAPSASASTYYGPGIAADGLANTTLGPYGNTVSYRFRAKHSGVLQQARVYLIPDHAGYAGGTGGTIQVTLNTDDATSAHNPTSTVLATYMMSNVLSLASPARYFYVMTFATPPTLTAGQLYHMVFKNVDASPTVNFLSVDALYEIVVATPVQPTISNIDEAVLLSNGGGTWQPRAGYTPIYELDFQNGASEGIGYMEGWVGAPQSISGNSSVRETITVSGTQVKVASASIRLARFNGNDPLVVRLENADGSLIEQGNVSTSGIALSTSSTSPSDAWVTYPFSTIYTLLPGNTYHLVFEAASTSTYQAFPIRKGLAYGFQNTTYFPDGYAEFQQNGSWVGWTQWGVTNRTDGDLQFYFSVVP